LPALFFLLTGLLDFDSEKNGADLKK